MRIRLDIAYLGTRFEGWQVQDVVRDGARPRTVQGDVQSALARLHGTEIAIHGAGRTDAGVHADGQVAHFDVPDGAPEIPLPGLSRGLNSILGEDVRVLSAAEVASDWHARFSAAGKVYVYRLRLGEVLHPHRGLVEALWRGRLDVDAMRRAAARLVGERDFARFSAGSHVADTVRRLVRLEVGSEDGGLVTFTAAANGFLRGMVRRLVGTLREVGRGRVAPEDALDRPGPTAEARGLTLARVIYPPDQLK
jgi:tRNA pseudouridine38-40 synthase